MASSDKLKSHNLAEDTHTHIHIHTWWYMQRCKNWLQKGAFSWWLFLTNSNHTTWPKTHTHTYTLDGTRKDVRIDCKRVRLVGDYFWQTQITQIHGQYMQKPKKWGKKSWFVMSLCCLFRRVEILFGEVSPSCPVNKHMYICNETLYRRCHRGLLKNEVQWHRRCCNVCHQRFHCEVLLKDALCR